MNKVIDQKYGFHDEEQDGGPDPKASPRSRGRSGGRGPPGSYAVWPIRGGLPRLRLVMVFLETELGIPRDCRRLRVHPHELRYVRRHRRRELHQEARRVLRRRAQGPGVLQRHGHRRRLDERRFVHLMAGTIWSSGYDGLAYIMGWTGGYVLLALFFAPYIRKFGQFTIPDFVGARYGGKTRGRWRPSAPSSPRSPTSPRRSYGVGVIMSRFSASSFERRRVPRPGRRAAVLVPGWHEDITWTQVAQYIILIIAYLVPVTFLSQQVHRHPDLGADVRPGARRSDRHRASSALSNYVEPFKAAYEQRVGDRRHPAGRAAGPRAIVDASWVGTPWEFLALTFALMAGTAGLPHILSATTPCRTRRPHAASAGRCSSSSCCTSPRRPTPLSRARGAAQTSSASGSRTCRRGSPTGRPPASTIRGCDEPRRERRRRASSSASSRSWEQNRRPRHARDRGPALHDRRTRRGRRARRRALDG